MDEDRKSRTQKKNEARALQKLGEELVALSPEQLANIEMTDELRMAVIEAVKIKSHGARRRQLQRIGTLMRDIDPEPIQEALENIRFGDHQKLLAFKKIEKWILSMNLTPVWKRSISWNRNLFNSTVPGLIIIPMNILSSKY